MVVTSRFSPLDGMRGIASIAVMMFHFNRFYLPQGSLGIVPFLDRAYLSVDLFFLMSGFVMAHVYGQKLASNWRAQWMEFARVRFARIYPLFALTTLTMVITHALSQMPLSFVSLTGGSLALQPLILQYLGSGLSWNYPSWSIGTETAAYVLFVYSAGTLVNGKYPWLIAAGCIAIILVISTAQGGRLNVYVGLPALLRTLAEFALGALLYRAHLGDTTFPRKWLAFLAVLCAFLSTLTHWDFLMVGAFACLIYYAVNASTVLGRLLSTRAAVALGAWSYSIYLWHAPTHYAFMAMFAAIGFPTSLLNAWIARLLILVTALTVVGLSALSFNYFEVPVRRWLRRTLRPPTLSVTT
jgi:peptidoglycan/LPS O-acetylase OafA/YrhL